jgi:putative glutamine amidotransferase
MKIAVPLCGSKTQNFINTTYIDYLIGAGLTPVFIPQNKFIEDLLKECDGLLLSGGIDIDPIYYGFNNIDSSGVSPTRDSFERNLIEYFLKNDKKIFGICRGFQLICLELFALGELKGEYIQDLKNHPTNTDVDRNIPIHFIFIDEKELYSSINNINFEKSDLTKIIFNFNNSCDKSHIKRIAVNSMHHQGFIIPKTYSDTKIIAIAPYDKNEFLVEAIKFKNILAVQWHPEELNDFPLIKNFFESK